MLNEPVRAALIVIGDEILSGRTKDLNTGYIADHLTDLGIRLCEVRIVADEADAIIEAVNALRERNDYVFTTGGIGPTHDDITVDAVAAAFGVDVERNERAVELMQARFSPDQLTESRLRMTRIPVSAELVENSVSAAPGFWIGNVIVFAGVPKIMHAMLDAVTPKLKRGRKLLSYSLNVFCPESEVALALGQVQNRYDDVSMGSYPFIQDGRFCTQLVLRSVDGDRVEEASEDLKKELLAQGIEDFQAVGDAEPV